MLISEIYQSRQGEGFLTGTPSVFVRTSGCNLRCGFCDTPFASWEPVGKQMSVSEIVEQVQLSAKPKTGDNEDSQSRHVVLTGGEPMLQREVSQLCKEIKSAGFHITIETAGTIFHQLDCDLMSISPKLSNSDPQQSRAGEWLVKHQSKRNQPDVVKHLLENYEYQLKFVVDTPDDLDEIIEYLQQINPKDQSKVLLMPQGIAVEELTKTEQWLIPLCQQHGFTFCPRKHIEWYGNKRGT